MFVVIVVYAYMGVAFVSFFVPNVLMCVLFDVDGGAAFFLPDDEGKGKTRSRTGALPEYASQPLRQGSRSGNGGKSGGSAGASKVRAQRDVCLRALAAML